MRMEQIKRGIPYLAVLLGMAAATPVLLAQIDIAALAQFKANQQRALAASLQTGQPAGGAHKRHGRQPSTLAAGGIERPALIQAHNPSFKNITGQSHRKNMR